MSENRVLPWKPELLEDLRRRYGAAISKTYNIMESMAQGEFAGFNAENVFDTEFGYRMIISRDKMPANLGSVTMLHVSGKRYDGLKVDLKNQRDTVLDIFRKISDHIGEPSMDMCSGISNHFYFLLS